MFLTRILKHLLDHQLKSIRSIPEVTQSSLTTLIPGAIKTIVHSINIQ
jgi:hypothetical protein